MTSAFIVVLKCRGIFPLQLTSSTIDYPITPSLAGSPQCQWNIWWHWMATGFFFLFLKNFKSSKKAINTGAGEGRMTTCTSGFAGPITKSHDHSQSYLVSKWSNTSTKRKTRPTWIASICWNTYSTACRPMASIGFLITFFRKSKIRNLVWNIA